MRKLVYLLIVLFAIHGCESTNNKTISKQTDYFYVKFDLEFIPELNIDTVRVNYNMNLKDSIYTLNYVYSTDTITYIFKESDKFKPECLLNGTKKKYNDFIYVAKESYIIKGQYFEVYKYASNPLTIDGCLTHFWTPEIGIIIARSTTWRTYRKLQTNNDSINDYINTLTELIYQNTEFYKGCTEELELIPKSDAQEYYKWKYKDIDVEDYD